MRLWTYQSIAHGADMVLYFRWRTATIGTEIYWHGINDYHNRPNRRVEEAARIGRELAIIGQRLVATQPSAQVALVSDYDNEWDGELDSWFGPYMRQSIQAWFAALQYQHIPVDSLTLRPATTLADLAAYRVLVYPHPAILSDATAELLAEYVRQGGTIIFGARTGYKDAHGHCYMRPFPGPVAELCGITVADFTRIGPYESAPSLRWRDADRPAVVADAFNDILQVESDDAEVLAEYAGGYYAGAPALARNQVGSGSAYYYGAVFNLEAATALITQLGLVSPVGAWLDLPQPVELCIRAQPDSRERLIFLLNYSAADQIVTLHKDIDDALSGERLSGSILLEPFGVRILADTDEPAT
jgi:beta-galactosidase